MTIQNLRPWSTELSERRWAIGIACACFIILISLPFWPEKKNVPEGEKLVKESIVNKQAMPFTPPQKTRLKATLKPVQSHTKQDNKKHILATKPRSTPIKTTQKNSPSISSQAYFIQAGAFRDENHAKKLKKKLTQKHWPVIIQKKKHLYAVQIGPYENKRKANLAKKQLSYKEKIKGFVTHHAYP